MGAAHRDGQRVDSRGGDESRGIAWIRSYPGSMGRALAADLAQLCL
jgi:hypothetical protein